MKRRIDYGCFLENVKELQNKYKVTIIINDNDAKEQSGTVSFTIPFIGCIEVSYMFKPYTEYPVSIAYYGGMQDYFKTFDAAFVRFEEILKSYIEDSNYTTLEDVLDKVSKDGMRSDFVNYRSDDDTDVDYETQDYDYEGPMGRD